MKNVTAKKTPAWWHLADPYLRWAHHTDFDFFEHGKGAHFGVLAALGAELDKKQHKLLTAAGVFVGNSYIGKRFVTADLEMSNRKAQLAVFAEIGAIRLELATPIASPRPAGLFPLRSPGISPRHLIGVVDDGCPFAHADLLAGKKSRVTFLWDQGATSARCQSAGSDYGYGYKFDEQSIARAIKLGTPAGAGAADEDSVYESAGQDRLRPLATHGAHVFGLAAASVPARNRISPSRFDQNRSDATAPPSWAAEPAPGPDLAFAFVQIPKDSLDDSSGRWLDRNILDGIHAILDYARSTKSVTRATINVSFGPQTGAHDGSSLLERAIDDLVSKPGDIEELFVVVAVGNSCQSRAHAEFDLEQGGGQLTWHVPPDSETPAFLEIWLPRGAGLSDAQVRITAADLESKTPVADRVAGSAQDSWHLVTSNAAIDGEPAQWVIVVALGATGGYQNSARPPHGRWIVSVTAGPRAQGCAHVYVARNDYNFGGLRRGRPSHLWLESYDPVRFMRSREYDPLEDGNNPRPAVQICSRGTVSGLATGELTNVAAGYRIADSEPAIYSSAGPSRGIRNGPDWAYPTDESRVFPGLNSWGTRSGASVRLAGTSAAAPQYARDIDRCGRKALPPEGDPPKNADPRVGWGRK
ncbi:MAG: hypothetical protein ABI654_15250 [Betaproteobacteria bacterium]